MHSPLHFSFSHSTALSHCLIKHTAFNFYFCSCSRNKYHFYFRQSAHENLRASIRERRSNAFHRDPWANTEKFNPKWIRCFPARCNPTIRFPDCYFPPRPHWWIQGVLGGALMSKKTTKNTPQQKRPRGFPSSVCWCPISAPQTSWLCQWSIQ